MYNFRCMDKGNDMMHENNMMYNGNMSMSGMECPVIYECPIERVCHREICHHVPHVCPIHTRIINHHVYKHTYSPQYTCSEENTVSNVQCGSCCQFR